MPAAQNVVDLDAERARRGVRHSADRIEALAARGRLRRARSLDRSRRSDELVAAAVDQAREGDADAVRFLYLRFADNVYAYVCSIVRDEHEAEDVTQQVFAKLLGRFPAYEARRAVPFSGWILRVAHNAAIDHIRARRSLPVADVHSPDTPDHDLSHERGQDLRAALETLPVAQREVVLLRLFHGLSTAEVAGRLGRSEHSVHALQHRAHVQLRGELTRLEAAPATLGRRGQPRNSGAVRQVGPPSPLSESSEPS